MKKLIIIAIVFLALPLSAQEHMKFMDVPINGSISQFTSALKIKGFKLDKTIETSALMSGLFSLKGEKPETVKLLVFAMNSKNLVHSVQVWFPREDVRTHFFIFKEILNKIYGLYEFDSGLTNTENNEFITIWKTVDGEITLNANFTYEVVTVTFSDKNNSELFEKEKNINAFPN